MAVNMAVKDLTVVKAGKALTTQLDGEDYMILEYAIAFNDYDCGITYPLKMNLWVRKS